MPTNCTSRLFCLFSLIYLAVAYAPQNISDFPKPSRITENVCGAAARAFICDPRHILKNNKYYQYLLQELQRIRDRTPCLCHGCSRHRYRLRTLVVGIAVADRIYMPANTSNRNHYLRHVARQLRVKWALGRCEGSENDALILYERSSNKLVYSFGSMVAARIGTQCIHLIQKHSSILFHTEKRLSLAVNFLSNAVRNPCCGQPCLYLNVNWYKMLAWVVGGVVLLSALTFFGRRVWARNMYVRTRVRSSAGGYPSVGLFGTRPARPRTGRPVGNVGSGSVGLFGARTGRPRSTSGAVPDADLGLPPDGAHVLYSTNAPPPYPGCHPGLGEGYFAPPIQQPPPYTGKPPAYSDVQGISPATEDSVLPPPPPPANEHNPPPPPPPPHL